MSLPYHLLLYLSLLTFGTAYFGNKELGIGQQHHTDLCFCQLKGRVDDCSCSVDTVDYFNNDKIYPRLQSLIVKDYFRYYKINLKRKCPFWVDNSGCAMRHCHVEACSPNDLPPGLLNAHQSVYFNSQLTVKYPDNRQSAPCNFDIDNELGYLNTTISAASQREFVKWQAHDDSQDNFCVVPDEGEDSKYVDLLLNPERYTGYKGKSAHRVWHTIYNENCFLPASSYKNYIRSSKLNGLCLEKRAFYRAVSGLHTSINIHLCSNYLLNDGGFGLTTAEGHWGPNLAEFQRRFSPETTNGEGPQWLKNLYFLYLLELRALAKAAPQIEAEQFFTGRLEDDETVQMAVKDLLQVVKAFPDHFDERAMFAANGNGESGEQLKREFREHFRNVSRIMDCVGCDKCRLWGKLQVHGIGTALKILFSGKFDERPTVQHPKQFQLQRNELVALFNSFARLSTSIYELEEFREMTR